MGKLGWLDAVAAAVCILAAVAASVAPALAEKRIALVIGNSDYRSFGRLANPANDAAAIAALFKRAGFDVVEMRTDLGIREMHRAIDAFRIAAREAERAVAYFAGHGIEMDGRNYLIAVDAALARDIDIPDEAIALDHVLNALDDVKGLRLVLLDACRDNPFANGIRRTLPSTTIGRGLARVDGLAADTLVAFATRAGAVALDGGAAGNSPFAAALVKHIASPGLDIRLAFGRVRDEVLRMTANQQQPFIFGQLGARDISLVAATAGTPRP